jgi:hypothetical protein
LFKNFAFSRGPSFNDGEGEDCDPSDIELREGASPSDAEKYCEDSDPPDADRYGVDIDSSECHEKGSVDDNDDGWCEGVNLSDGE